MTKERLVQIMIYLTIVATLSSAFMYLMHDEVTEHVQLMRSKQCLTVQV